MSSSYIRDPRTGVVINTDDSHYKAILADRQLRKQSSDLQNQINNLNKDMAEIRNLLVQVVNGINNGQNGS